MTRQMKHRARISVKDTIAIIGIGLMFGAGMLVIYVLVGKGLSWMAGLVMNAWLCPKCHALIVYGHTTAFGRYTEADAMLNHIEANHPEWAAGLGVS